MKRLAEALANKPEFSDQAAAYKHLMTLPEKEIEKLISGKALQP